MRMFIREFKISHFISGQTLQSQARGRQQNNMHSLFQTLQWTRSKFKITLIIYNFK